MSHRRRRLDARGSRQVAVRRSQYVLQVSRAGWCRGPKKARFPTEKNAVVPTEKTGMGRAAPQHRSSATAIHYSGGIPLVVDVVSHGVSDTVSYEVANTLTDVRGRSLTVAPLFQLRVLQG